MDAGTQLFEQAADRGSNDRGRGIGGRTFTMFHGTSWRSWQRPDEGRPTSAVRLVPRLGAFIPGAVKPR